MDQTTSHAWRYQIRPATPVDADYVLFLATRVQAALTASGSLQELTPSILDTILASIHHEELLIFTYTDGNFSAQSAAIGSVTVSPFSPSSGHGSSSWGIEEVRGKTWYLHSLMLEPTLQGNGLGKNFLEEALRSLGQRHGAGPLVLDCWAGNQKLRRFYEEAGFRLVRIYPEEGYEIAVYEIQLRAC